MLVRNYYYRIIPSSDVLKPLSPYLLFQGISAKNNSKPDTTYDFGPEVITKHLSEWEKATYLRQGWRCRIVKSAFAAIQRRTRTYPPL